MADPSPVFTAPPKEENVLLEWEAMSRPFQPRTKEFYKTAMAIVFLFSVILVFVGEFMLIGAIVATAFVMYVLSTVPPERIKNRVTALGIETAGHFHKWEELREFWFDVKAGQPMVVISTILGFPSHLQLLLGNVSTVQVKKLFDDKLPYKEQPERTFLDRASGWLAQKLPLDKAR